MGGNIPEDWQETCFCLVFFFRRGFDFQFRLPCLYICDWIVTILKEEFDALKETYGTSDISVICFGDVCTRIYVFGFFSACFVTSTFQ